MEELISKHINRKILLNPGPATTSARVKRALLVEDICPREEEFGNLICNVRKKSKDVVFGDDKYETILLGSSGTGAIESCLRSCVDTDDRILIIENGAYGKRMKLICDSLGINHEVYSNDSSLEIDLDKLETFLTKNSERFRVLAFVHHETTTGILNPLSKLQNLAEKFNLVSLVDAMSSYAGIIIDVNVNKVDYLVSSSNKCIQGMAGLGIVIAKASELSKISNFEKKSFYFDLYENYLSQKEKKNFLFTPPVQVLFSLNEALDEFFEEGGIQKRSLRYAELYKVMFDGMCSLGFRPLVKEAINSKILTTFFEPNDEHYSFDNMHDFLFQRGITIYPGKIEDKNTFRIANIGELNIEDIQFFLQNIKEYLTHSEIQLNEK